MSAVSLVVGCLAAGCGDARLSAGRERHGGHANEQQSFERFWKEFQAAVRSGKADRVMALTALPLPQRAGGSLVKDLGGSNDEKGFREAFDRLFREECRREILSTPAAGVRYSPLEPGNPHAAEWGISHAEQHPGRSETGEEMSEGEWAVFYQFARTPAGIRLVGIKMAG